ncbi:MAG: UvrD-helicase domain-containing protein [Candidatus Pacebacteria bacterium]|nr:UvrD-helicase domain-containing protein [Candidatus Paceibacterota bacterium]
MTNQKRVLNPEQQEAVKYGQGPLLIIAGAGTGKTTVVTERVKYLILEKKVKPSQILALTFTDKAAREMEERIDIALPYGCLDRWIFTFHAFGDRILRDEASQIGLDSGFRLMNQAETVSFLTQNLFFLKLDYFRPLGNPTKFLSGLIQHFSRLKDEDVSPQEYLLWAKSQVPNPKSRTEAKKQEAEKYLELAGAYRQYERLKIKEGVADFGDLVANSLKLFRTRRNVLACYQKKFKYILVDEFQDTNIAQYELVKLLASPAENPNLTVVGDDSQSIYKFRGAAVSNILEFKKDFPQAKQITLIKNYRSTQTILDRAYQLIKHNDPDTLEIKLGISKDLISARKIVGEPVEFIPADRVENEAEEIAGRIKDLKKENYAWSDFAILVRANNHAEPFVKALARQGIPYQFLGPGQLFRQPEVKDLIAYLELLDNFTDSVACFRVLSMKHFNFSGRDLAALLNFSRKHNLSLFEAAEAVDQILVSEETRERINLFVKMVHRHLDLLAKETAGQIAYYFLKDTGLLKMMADQETIEEEKRTQNLAKFFDRLKTYETDHEDASVGAVIGWIRLSLDLGESPLASNFDWEGEDRVNLLTVHSSKGLEFPVVFLPNLVAARFPTRRRREQIPLPEALIKEVLSEGDFHLQEERRLFYVGMTRARDRLFFTAAKFYGEGKREAGLSPFVVEALGQSAAEKVLNRKKVEEKSQQLSILDFAPAKDSQTSMLPSRPAVNYLSFSQINTFITCPRQYRYRHLLKIPVPVSAAFSFGQVIHQTLKDFYQGHLVGEELTVNSLLKLYRDNWQSVGYRNKAHEKRMKARGKKILRDFFQKGFDRQVEVAGLEQSFVIKLGPDLKVGGRIDRIDKTKTGLQLLDYKTGQPWEQKRVDQSLQMTIYALALTSNKSSLFSEKTPEEITLSFYFLETGEKKSTKRNQKDLAKAQEELLEKKDIIQTSDFTPTPGPWCNYCDYKLLCQAWR